MAGGRVDIKVGFACNNHCLFCVQGEEKRLKHGPEKPEDVRAILDRERASGKDEVVFTGGEPTLHKDIVEFVRYARQIGFSMVALQSNGQNFSDLDFCKRLKEAGLSVANPSLHGFRPETHDLLTRTKGAWRRTTQGIRNMASIGVPVNVNSVLTKQNYREAPQLARLLHALGVKSFQYAFPHILGSAAVNKADIVPRKTDCAPYVQAGLRAARELGIVALVEAFTECTMRGYEWALMERNLPRTSVHDAGSEIQDYERWRLESGKAKGPRCAHCRHHVTCEGPWAEYPELYGWDEFVPLTA